MFSFFYVLKNAYEDAVLDKNVAKQIMERYKKAIKDVSKVHVLLKQSIDSIDNYLYFFPKISRQNMVKPFTEMFYGGIRENRESHEWIRDSCVNDKFIQEIGFLNETLKKIKNMYRNGDFKGIIEKYGDSNPKKVGKLEYGCDKPESQKEEKTLAEGGLIVEA